MKDDLDLERERRALSVRPNMVARRFSQCTVAINITLFKVYCTSLYAGNLWLRYLYPKGLTMDREDSGG